MKPTLQLKLSQHLALTPQLQQSIRLLQLSTTELNQELEQILAENPMIERLDDPLDGCARISPSGAIDAPPPASHVADDAAVTSLPRQDSTEDNEAGHDRDGEALVPETDPDWGADTRSPRDGQHDHDDQDFPQLGSGGTTLRHHLLQQLAGTRCAHRDRTLVTLLIEELDSDGYLQASLEELHEALPAELEIAPEELSTALQLLQSFDPTGVGARHLTECLSLQLRAIRTNQNAPEAIIELSQTLISEHLPALAARDFARLKRTLHCHEEPLRAAAALIRSLNPRPGNGFTSDPPRYVVPDIRVRRSRSGWLATLNSDVVPRLCINDAYAAALKTQRANSNPALNSQLQEARWLIKNVQQRFETILRVSQAIVDRQSAFFTHGAVAMRPLVLREIADVLGLHESTISRVTNQKYMLTPSGTFELKYFFGSHVATDTGGAASSTAIRAMIKQLVSSEDTKTPLSDSQIAELLGEQGIVVARRTVAKYREALLIPPVSQRKTL